MLGSLSEEGRSLGLSDSQPPCKYLEMRRANDDCLSHLGLIWRVAQLWAQSEGLPNQALETLHERARKLPC